MGRKRSVDEAIAGLQRLRRSRDVKVFRDLPPGIPPQVLVRAVVGCLTDGRSFALRELRGAPVEYVRALLASFERRREFTPTFLRALQPDDGSDAEVVAAWKLGLDSCLWHQPDLKHVAERRRIVKLARHREVARAVLEAVAVTRDVPAPMLAVALAQGESALDAILPHVAAAERDEARLDLLRKAAPAAPPGFRVFHERVAALMERRRSSSPLGGLAEQLGVGPIRGALTLTSPKSKLTLEFDPRERSWVTPRYYRFIGEGKWRALGSVKVTPPRTTEALPAWIRELDRGWDWPGSWRGSLTPAHRKRFLEWLQRGRVVTSRRSSSPR